jgi:two-component system chemotaxis response regulator CheY
MNVLIVDDLVVNRFFLKQTLKTLGHEVSEAPDGLQALKLIDKQCFDVIFMDIEMPVMNGFETIASIRDTPRFSNLKVVAITSHDAAFDNNTSAFSKFDGFIAKPLTAEKLKKYLSC